MTRLNRGSGREGRHTNVSEGPHTKAIAWTGGLALVVATAGVCLTWVALPPEGKISVCKVVRIPHSCELTSEPRPTAAIPAAVPTITITAAGVDDPIVVARGRIVIATVTSGADSTKLVVQKISGAGELLLGPLGPDGSRQIIYAAPLKLAASFVDNVTYRVTIADHLATASGTASVQLDAGPIITAGDGPFVVVPSESVVIGTAIPGVAGSKLVIDPIAGAGKVYLGAFGPNGRRQIIYTAPSELGASNLDTVTYRVSVEGRPDAAALATASVQLDGPPIITPVDHAIVVGPNQPVVIGSVAPRIAGSELYAVLTAGIGSVSLRPAPNGMQEIIYSAPQFDTSIVTPITYTVAVKGRPLAAASETARIQLDAGPKIVSFTQPEPVGPGETRILGAAVASVRSSLLRVEMTAGIGSVSLDPEEDGVRRIRYSPPDDVSVNTVAVVNYTITVEGRPLAAASGTATVQLRPVTRIEVQPSGRHVGLGLLRCDIASGIGAIIFSTRTLTCRFSPATGPSEYYAGTFTKVGLDLGVTSEGVMVWEVVAPTSQSAGALAGRYGGASVEASVGAGFGVNVLFGGSDRTVMLQPVSLQGQTGLNLAAGFSDIELRLVDCVRCE